MRAPPYEKRQTAKRVYFYNYSKITQNNTNLQIHVIIAYTIYSLLQIPRQKNKIEFKLKDYKEIIKMGVKSKSQAINLPSQTSKPYEKSGLIFESRNAYDDLKNIDLNANQLVDAIKAGSLDMKEFFSRFDKVKVKETYIEASENLDELFENITDYKRSRLF